METENKVNLEKLDLVQLETTAAVVGDKVNKILVSAKEEVDKILKVYGLQLDLGYEIKSIDTIDNQRSFTEKQ